MKKILIVDSRPPQPTPDFARFPFVVWSRGFLPVDTLNPKDFDAAFVHSKDSTQKDWARDHLSHIFVFGSEVVAYAEKGSVIYLPRALFYERIEHVLQKYQRTETIDAGLFSVTNPGAGLASEESRGSEQQRHLLLSRMRVRGLKAANDSAFIEVHSPLVIFGRNGSGKSSLLEALQWLQSASIWGVQRATQEWFHSFSDMRTRGAPELRIDLAFDAEEGAPSFTYALAIREDPQGLPVVSLEERRVGERVVIKTVVKGDVAIREIAGGNPVSDGDVLALTQVSAVDPGSARRVLAFLRHAVFLRLSPRVLAQRGSLELPVRGPLLKEEGVGLPALLESLGEAGRASVLALLRATLNPEIRIEEVGLNRDQVDRSGVLVMDQQLPGPQGVARERLPAWVLSEGTRRLTAVYALLTATPGPSLLAVEEIENGLDPWTLDRLLQALQQAASNGIPVLLTTHSPYFLNRFAARNLLHAQYRNGQAIYRSADSYASVREYEGDVPAGVLYVNELLKD